MRRLKLCLKKSIDTQDINMKVLSKKILLNRFNLFVHLGMHKEAMSSEYEEIYRQLSRKAKARIIIKHHFPGGVKILTNMRRNLFI